MSARHRLIYSAIANSFGRKLSGPDDRGWGDTIVGPLDPLRESDFRVPTTPGLKAPGGSAPTMPMGLPSTGPEGRGFKNEKNGWKGRK